MEHLVFQEALFDGVMLKPERGWACLNPAFLFIGSLPHRIKLKMKKQQIEKARAHCFKQRTADPQECKYLKIQEEIAGLLPNLSDHLRFGKYLDVHKHC